MYICVQQFSWSEHQHRNSGYKRTDIEGLTRKHSYYYLPGKFSIVYHVLACPRLTSTSPDVPACPRARIPASRHPTSRRPRVRAFQVPCPRPTFSHSHQKQFNRGTEEKVSRIPLILTYRPLNTRVQRILLDNFKVIADDPATSLIFPQPPMVTYRRDDNLRTSLVHTTEMQAATRAGTYPCEHPRCRTCGHISSETDLLGPKDRLTFKDSFTCLSSGLIYCISCR